MLNLSASEQPLVSGRGSSRLLAHRLANFDAEQARIAGPGFEAAWKARHGGAATQPSPPTPAAAITTPAPRTVAATMPAPAVTPPAIAKEIQAAADQKHATIAKAAADFKARQMAEQEQAARRAASAAVWEKAWAGSERSTVSEAGQASPQKAADDVWARVYAKAEPERTVAGRSASSVWDRANSKVMADRGRV